MSKQMFFVYISLFALLACGEDVETGTSSGEAGQPGGSGPTLSQEGKLQLTPCDQITSGDQSACETSIYSVKNTAASPGVPDDSRVAVVGIVTGLRINADNLYSHLVLSSPSNDPSYQGEDYSSIWIYLNNADDETLREQPPVLGSYVQVVGSVKTHFGQRQLEKVEQVVSLTESPMIPDAIEVASTDVALNGPRAWGLEGALVTVRNVTVVNASPTPGPGDGMDGSPTYEFEVDGGLIVNDFIYSGLPQPANGDTYAQITGFLRYANNTFKLEPRNAQDIY
ncbi:MAG: hypothetical protein ACPGQS_10125 [Bradymonadia bacterium]